MSYTLDFVESPGGAVRLHLDDANIKHIGDRTHIPLPDHYKQWAESSLTDGRRPVGDGKYGNVPLTLSFGIFADSIANLDAKARALIAEITRDNWLKFSPEGGSPLYYRTYHYDKGDPGTLQDKLHRLNKFAWEFTVGLEAELPVGTEQTLTIVENLVSNWDFTDRTGDDFDDWTEIEIGTATVSAETADYFIPSVSVSCLATNSGSLAYEESPYIEVDSSRHHCFFYNCKIIQAVASPGNLHTIPYINCYDAGHNLLGTLGDYGGAVATLIPQNSANWQAKKIAIHPEGETTESFYFFADTVYVKIFLGVNVISGTGNDETLFDAVCLTESEYLIDNILGNPAAIDLYPASDVLGDVPALADFYFTKFGPEVYEMTALYLGGRKNYNSGFSPIFECDAAIGVAGINAHAYGSNYRSMVIGSELITNNGLNTITGTAGSNTETWDNWTASRGGVMIAQAAKKKEGAYAIKNYLSALGAAATNTLTSTAFIAVNIANDHYLSIWYLLKQLSGLARFKAEILCYNAASAYINTLMVKNTRANRNAWTPAYLDIPAANWPALTAKVKIHISATVGWPSGHDTSKHQDKIYFDFCSLKEGPPVFLSDAADVNFSKGRIKPFWHYRITSAQASKDISLQSRLEDLTGDYTPWLEIAHPTLDLPGVWTFQGDGLIDPFELPTFPIPSDQDAPGFQQEFQIKLDSALTATSIYSDLLALIPTDGGLAVLGAEDNEHIIVDSQSDLPAFLRSFNGLKNQGLIMDEGKVSRPFKVDPNGSNFACLLVWTDESGNQPAQFFSNLKIKYRPRYLVVV